MKVMNPNIMEIPFNGLKKFIPTGLLLLFGWFFFQLVSIKWLLLPRWAVTWPSNWTQLLITSMEPGMLALTVFRSNRKQGPDPMPVFAINMYGNMGYRRTEALQMENNQCRSSIYRYCYSREEQKGKKREKGRAALTCLIDFIFPFPSSWRWMSLNLRIRSLSLRFRKICLTYSLPILPQNPFSRCCP